MLSTINRDLPDQNRCGDHHQREIYQVYMHAIARASRNVFSARFLSAHFRLTSTAGACARSASACKVHEALHDPKRRYTCVTKELPAMTQC